MLRISQTRIVAWNTKNYAASQQTTRGTTNPLSAVSSDAPVGGSDLPERIPARSVPPDLPTVAETTKPSSSIEGWDSEGGAQPAVN
jgi:hypothetical protein